MTRIYKTEADRQRAISQLRNHGYNEFVVRQTDQGHTLQYSKGNWPSGVYTLNR